MRGASDRRKKRGRPQPPDPPRTAEHSPTHPLHDLVFGFWVFAVLEHGACHTYPLCYAFLPCLTCTAALLYQHACACLLSLALPFLPCLLPAYHQPHPTYLALSPSTTFPALSVASPALILPFFLPALLSSPPDHMLSLPPAIYLMQHACLCPALPAFSWPHSSTHMPCLFLYTSPLPSALPSPVYTYLLIFVCFCFALHGSVGSGQDSLALWDMWDMFPVTCVLPVWDHTPHAMPACLLLRRAVHTSYLKIDPSPPASHTCPLPHAPPSLPFHSWSGGGGGGILFPLPLAWKHSTFIWTTCSLPPTFCYYLPFPSMPPHLFYVPVPSFTFVHSLPCHYLPREGPAYLL